MLKIPAVKPFATRALEGALVALCVAALAASLATGTAHAQSRKNRDGSAPANPPAGEAKPGGESGSDSGPGKTEPAKPDAAKPEPAEPPKLKSALSNMPKTADEKARQLSDLYAQLATADDEATAKKYADAIERLWMLSGSDTVHLLMERANVALRKNKPEIAETLLDRVVALAPDYAEGFNQRAYFHYVRNNYDAAVGDLRRVLALDPNHFKALEGLAQIWRDTGNKKGAFGVMKQLMDVYPLASGAKSAFDELKREVDGQGI